MSHPLGREHIIEFLVRRKYPPLVLASLSNAVQPKDITTVGRGVRRDEVNRYRSKLQSLPSDELRTLYDNELPEASADQQREEERRFFNQPHAAADFDHWSKAEHWSLDEAIALIMGKAPEIVSWDKIKAYSNISPFVKQYARLRDLAERAKAWQKLFDPVLPPILLKWAADNEIAVPAELAEKVSRFKGKFVDWKKNYDELQSAYDQHIDDWKAVADKQSDLIKAKQNRIVQLEAELAALREAAPASDSTKVQSPIERQNMLKAIYAMAAKGYGYDPTMKRSTIVSEIVSDLALAGVPLSEDTVRRYLKEALDNVAEWREASS